MNWWILLYLVGQLCGLHLAFRLGRVWERYKTQEAA